MQVKQISPNLSVAGQVSGSDLDRLAADGIKSIICNRPDGEESGQPSFDEVAQAAQKLGIEMRYIPITVNGVTNEDMVQFGTAMNELAGPVLAYCRSGARSAHVWAMVQKHAENRNR